MFAEDDELMKSLKILLNHTPNALHQLLEGSDIKLNSRAQNAISRIDLMPTLFKSSPQLVRSWSFLSLMSAFSSHAERWVKMFQEEHHAFAHASLTTNPFHIILENIAANGAALPPDAGVKAVPHPLPSDLQSFDMATLMKSLVLVLSLRPEHTQACFQTIARVTSLGKVLEVLHQMQARKVATLMNPAFIPSPFGMASPIQLTIAELVTRILKTEHTTRKVGIYFYSGEFLLENFLYRGLSLAFPHLPPIIFSPYPTIQQLETNVVVAQASQDPLKVLTYLESTTRVRPPAHLLLILLKHNDPAKQSLLHRSSSLFPPPVVEAIARTVGLGAEVGVLHSIKRLGPAIAHSLIFLAELFKLAFNGLNIPKTSASTVGSGKQPTGRIPNLFKAIPQPLFPIVQLINPNVYSRHPVFNQKAARLLTGLLLHSSFLITSPIPTLSDKAIALLRSHILPMLHFSGAIIRRVGVAERMKHAERFTEWPAMPVNESAFVPFPKVDNGRLYVGPLIVPHHNIDPPFIIPTLPRLLSDATRE
eukprot:gnl/Dysnectes_brevis/7494_a12612_190.p1 GENE.gnl/Dysnectes_brevis/7494_a12612_190~~gnl/Dysnectes_brevis/7494_a12612_190.p1  ORF type:complete len:534 (-),score=42.48 gnl/Dysnectes_brevis/7494_a12612_190:25-1626(-)